MGHPSPLRNRHVAYAEPRRPDPEVVAHRTGAARGEQAEAPAVAFVAWGPPGVEAAPCELVATYGDPESEYAAVRKGAGLLDAPHRGTIRIGGDDRCGFLDRMVTQKLAGLEAGGCRETFWLNRKGRIDADLLLIERGADMLADVDVHAAARAAASLAGFVFTEDVEILDVTAGHHHIGVHGPEAVNTVAAAAGVPLALEPLTTADVVIAGATVTVARRDLTGGPGLELIMAREAAGAVWDALVATDEAISGSRRRVRPVGWYALNIARIEAGVPIFNIDFGPSSLPHETGLLERRVNFAKGCYLGQEIVARTHSLGKPKQQLVGLRPGAGRLPEAGAAVLAGATGGEPVGVVTSSTLSPMLGAVPVAFAMVRTAALESATGLAVEAEGELVPAEVTALTFWTADP